MTVLGGFPLWNMVAESGVIYDIIWSTEAKKITLVCVVIYGPNFVEMD